MVRMGSKRGTSDQPGISWACAARQAVIRNQIDLFTRVWSSTTSSCSRPCPIARMGRGQAVQCRSPPPCRPGKKAASGKGDWRGVSPADRLPTVALCDGGPGVAKVRAETISSPLASRAPSPCAKMVAGGSGLCPFHREEKSPSFPQRRRRPVLLLRCQARAKSSLRSGDRGTSTSSRRFEESCGRAGSPCSTTTPSAAAGSTSQRPSMYEARGVGRSLVPKAAGACTPTRPGAPWLFRAGGVRRARRWFASKPVGWAPEGWTTLVRA